MVGRDNSIIMSAFVYFAYRLPPFVTTLDCTNFIFHFQIFMCILLLRTYICRAGNYFPLASSYLYATAFTQLIFCNFPCDTRWQPSGPLHISLSERISTQRQLLSDDLSRGGQRWLFGLKPRWNYICWIVGHKDEQFIVLIAKYMPVSKNVVNDCNVYYYNNKNLNLEINLRN